MALTVAAVDIQIGADMDGAISGIKSIQKSMLGLTNQFKDQEGKIKKNLGGVAATIGALASTAQGAGDTIRSSLSNLPIDIDSSPLVNNLLGIADITDSVSNAMVSGFDAFRSTSVQVTESLSSLAAGVPKIGAGMAAIAGPVGLVLGGIAAGALIIVNNFDAIAGAAFRVTNKIREWYNEYKPIRIAVESIQLGVKGLVELGSLVVKSFKILGTTIQAIWTSIKTGDFSGIKTAITNAFDASIKVVRESAEVMRVSTAKALSNIIINPKLQPLSKEEFNSKYLDPIRAFASRFGITLGGVVEVGVDEEATLSKIQTGIQEVRPKIEALPDIGIKLPFEIEQLQLQNQITSNLDKQLQQIGKRFQFLKDPVGQLKAEIRATEQALIEMGTSGVAASSSAVKVMQGNLDGLRSQLSALNTEMNDTIGTNGSLGESYIELGALIEQSVGTFIDDFANQFAQGTLTLGGAVNSMLGVLGGFLDALGDAAIKAGLGVEAVKVSIAGFNGLPAIAAGVVLKGIGKLFQSGAQAALPSLAIGTDMVKSDGLAMLHKGEAVVPANVVSGGYTESNNGRGSTVLYSRVRGSDIILSSERARYAQNWTG